jgi:hypothetical protein
MASGARSLADTEALTDALSPALRRFLGIARRIADTTLRDALCTLGAEDVVASLHAIVHAAHLRKALEPEALPFGVVALDGKGFSVPSSDDWVAQRQTSSENGPLIGVIRTVTATLTSSRARPCIDVVPIPAPTNEMGVFVRALDHVLDAYGKLDLFRLITYDAGACSLENATAVRSRGLHYLFGLKSTQPTLWEEARRWLGSRSADQADAVTEERDHGGTVARRLYLGPAVAAPEGWEHLRTVARIETETRDANGSVLSCENRYFISSLPASRLSPPQWLLVVRQHWGVETTHQILDVAFDEDERPWIESDPPAALVVAVLRRITYTLLTLFRSVTQRSEERRAVPWAELLRSVFLTLVTTTYEQLAGLRPHLRLRPS